MAKVTMMESGLRRKQTYEQIIDYIQNDQDKIKYPNRTAKFLRHTFQLSQLDGMGQALLEQQGVNEMAERVKDYQLNELADQNETSKRIEDAKSKSTQTITEQPASSSSGGGGGGDDGGGGVLRKVVGGVITAVPYVASGAGHVVSGVGSVLRGAVNVASYAGSLLPTGHGEEDDNYVNYVLSEHSAQISQQLRREQENQQQLRFHLQDVQHQQHSINQHVPLPIRDMSKAPFQGGPPIPKAPLHIRDMSKAPFQGGPPISKAPLHIRDMSKAPFQGGPPVRPLPASPLKVSPPIPMATLPIRDISKAPFQGGPPKAPFQGYSFSADASPPIRGSKPKAPREFG